MGIFHCAELTHRRLVADPTLFLRCEFVDIRRVFGVTSVMRRRCSRCPDILSLSLEAVAEMYPLPLDMGELVTEYLRRAA